MTQVTNPTTPVSSVQNPTRGLDVIGTQGDNRLLGTEQADIILTFGGNDVISGRGGDDLIISGGGNDSIGGGAGNDDIFAGTGNDVVDGGSGDDRIFGGKGSDVIDGNAGNDFLSGDNGDDRIFGGAGNDTALGGKGNDLVSGGDGNDSLYGGRDNDTVDGGAGDDFISGDRGADVLTGGAGSDTFYFASPAGVDGNGLDTITDFNPAEDKIRLKASAFPGLGSSFDATDFIVVSGFNANSATANTANKVVYDPQSGLLFYNGAGGVQTIAQLQTGLNLAAVNTGTRNNFELF
ncbi:calcium-binding protein [Microcoleus sp. bin38.metabat.b11b12b14.051]|uniref:calcium-binding protein n=1 Tax=Microcoleus sp. bin38.metabat.b11b12b14.051 TaxID=2742709 RepID=UPI0025F97C47|nr:calcium-binding protein [Microcoleus sp. bin38.metabat.b11b12b14.051]